MSIQLKNLSKLAVISVALFGSVAAVAADDVAPSAQSNSQQIQIPVTATVVTGCSVGSLNGKQAKLDFGRFSTLDQAIDAQTTLVISCTGANSKNDTNNLQPKLTFSSANAQSNNGQPTLTMAGDKDTAIDYNLYSDNTYSLAVPHGLDETAAQPVKLGNYTIYAQIPAKQSASLTTGEYSDSVTATLYW